MIYLDNASSTKPLFYPLSSASNLWMNSNANYFTNSKQELERCEKKIKKLLGLNKGHIVFMRSASECAKFLISEFHGRITCSKYEHECVYDEIQKIIPDSCQYDFIHFQMLVNNITGEIFDLSKVRQKEKCDYLVCDATATIGKVYLPTDIENNCDALFFSGRKIHSTPIGVLWLNDSLFKYYGGTENDIRNNYGLFHGTTDVESVCALTTALDFVMNNVYNNQDSWKQLNDYLIKRLDEEKIKYNIISPQNKAEYLTLIELPNINAESLQIYCMSKDCYIGIGRSACSNKTDNNRILDLMNVKNKDNVIRISYGLTTTSLDIDGFVKILKKYYNSFVK